MKIYASIIALLSAISGGSAFTLIWNAPDGYKPDAYIILHGTISGAYSEINNAGSETNFDWNAPLPAGVNYFTVAALKMDDGYNLQMSGLSNETVVTNTPQIIITEILLTSTNVTGNWQPLSTNSVQFSPSLPQQFFTSQVSVKSTNVITAPK